MQVGDEILEIQGIPVTGRNSEMPTGFKHAILGPKVELNLNLNSSIT